MISLAGARSAIGLSNRTLFHSLISIVFVFNLSQNNEVWKTATTIVAELEEQAKASTIPTNFVDNSTTAKTKTKSSPATRPVLPQRTTGDATPKDVVVDMISVGTIHNPALQDAQQMTFGSNHNMIRDFYWFNEYNDTESTCHRVLTTQQAMNIADHCGSPRRDHRTEQYRALDLLRREYLTSRQISAKSNPAGWVCAQKRPIDALHRVLMRYQEAGATLPDYLILMDDDTYLDLDLVVPYLSSRYPSNEAYAIAGCLLKTTINERTFSIPYGGYSTTLSKMAIQNFITPIHCNDEEDDDDAKDDDDDALPSFWSAASSSSDKDFSFTQEHVCRRIQEDNIGERALFMDGMSVADLMYAYAFHQPFINFENWNDVGYCMHSDTTISYFINYYNIPKHSNGLPDANYDDIYNVFENRIMPYNNSILDATRNSPEEKLQRGQCRHSRNSNCKTSSHLCHKISNEQMKKLHRKKQAEFKRKNK